MRMLRTNRDEVIYFAQWLPQYPDVFIIQGSMFDSCYTARSNDVARSSLDWELALVLFCLFQIHFQPLTCSSPFPELSLFIYKVEIIVLLYYSSTKHLEIIVWKV